MQATRAWFRPGFSPLEKENLPLWSCFPILPRENCRLKTVKVCHKYQDSGEKACFAASQLQNPDLDARLEWGQFTAGIQTVNMTITMTGSGA
jgi:hypothetical protein